MLVEIAYGKNVLKVELPEQTDVLQPEFMEGVANPEQALRDAFENPIGSKPLSELVNPDSTVVIVHSDITRPTPNHIMIPVLTSELERHGVKPENITLLNALGTHREQTDDELRTMLTPEVVDRYTCLQSDCYDDNNLVSLGQTSFGNPVRINKQYMEADVKILTGFIEPHFFAGFSGGPKGVLPSIAGIESVLSNHGSQMIAHGKATWGECEGNPIWEEMLEVAMKTDPTFLLNVTLNSKKEITGIFAGALEETHRQGREFCRKHSMIGVDEPYDIVITSNSGYPLDLNLYQSVKGMTAAEKIVKTGGKIIVAAECWDGIPDHGKFAELLRGAESAQQLLDMIMEPGFSAHDQWQAQMLANIRIKADVQVYSDGLSDEQIRESLMEPTHDIDGSVRSLLAKYGDNARICVLPDGPQAAPYLKSNS